jgi:hypothetical protein
MVYVHDYSHRPVAMATQERRLPLRRVSWSVGQTVLVFGFGGAICGALALNVVSLVYCPLTLPCGFLLGAVFCLPVSVPIAWWLSRQPDPDAQRLARILQFLLGGIALAVNGTTNIWFAVETAPNPSESPIYAVATVAWLTLAVSFALASGFVGWKSGATLAQLHVQRLGHPTAPARRSALRSPPRPC